MKKIYFLLILPLFLFAPLASKAYVVKSNDFIYVAKDEVIEGNLYFQAKSVTIEGQVWGDVIGVSPNLQINGQVKGDVLAIAQNINITGKVDGDLRIISNTTNISGNISKNINFLGESLVLTESSSAGQDILLASVNSEFNGKVAGNIHGTSNNVLIRGEVSKDINLTIDQTKRKKYLNTLKIEEPAVVMGSLNYKAGNNALITSENIKGEINKKDPNKAPHETPNAGKIIYSILSAFLMAILLHLLFKEKIKNLKNIIINKNYKTIGYGAIILFLTPIASLIAMITVIGIPIAIIALIIWGIMLFLSTILVALAVGDYFFKLIKKEKLSWYLKALVGIILMTIICAVPFVGWFIKLIAALIGLGSFYYLIKK